MEILGNPKGYISLTADDVALSFSLVEVREAVGAEFFFNQDDVVNRFHPFNCKSKKEYYQVQVKINPNKATIYSSLPVQVFMIHAIKTPLMEGIGEFFSLRIKNKIQSIKKILKAYKAFQKLPEPFEGNTWHPNTHNIISLKEWFCKRYWFLRPIRKHIRRLFDFWAIIYDFDPPWRMMMDELREESLHLEWSIFRSTFNIIYLRDWFFTRCGLAKVRIKFIWKLFNLLIIFTIVLPFWFKALKAKFDSLEWKEKGYGVALPPKYIWWKAVSQG